MKNLTGFDFSLNDKELRDGGGNQQFPAVKTVKNPANKKLVSP